MAKEDSFQRGDDDLLCLNLADVTFVCSFTIPRERQGGRVFVGLVAAGIFFLVGLAISFYHNVIKKKPRKEGADEQAFK